MEGDDHRRKVIVCVGAPAVCNIAEPPKVALRALWPRWVRVLTSAAKANVSIYAIVPGRATLRGGGLSDYTGGEVFATTYRSWTRDPIAFCATPIITTCWATGRMASRASCTRSM